jgi:hypothetical protein
MKRHEPRERMEKMYKDVRKVSEDGLYRLAIKEQWFTRATNEEYGNWLDYSLFDEISVNDIEDMAKMVMEYSKLDEGMEMESIMFLIEREACYHFFVRW